MQEKEPYFSCNSDVKAMRHVIDKKGAATAPTSGGVPTQYIHRKFSAVDPLFNTEELIEINALIEARRTKSGRKQVKQ